MTATNEPRTTARCPMIADGSAARRNHGRTRGSRLLPCWPVGSIQVNKVSWRRPGSTMVFEDVSFRIPEGSHAALVGANGVGKTTLVRLICGDDAPTDGSIHVDGR